MVGIVTDSASDVPPELARELGITVVPLNIHFGAETFRDGVDLTAADFYSRLEATSVLPTTSAPGPGVFASIFDALSSHCTEILGLFLSRRFSSTYDSALQGMKLMCNKCRVEIVDTTLGIMGEGLLVIEAARNALAGASLAELVSQLSRTIPLVHVRATLDTLKYLAKGGRIGKAQAFLGSILRLNPILGIKNGEAFPYIRMRSRSQAVKWLYGFATKFKNVKALAIEYGTNFTEAKELAGRISSVFPEVPVFLSNVSPVIGTHAGPNILAVTVLEAN